MRADARHDCGGDRRLQLSATAWQGSSVRSMAAGPRTPRGLIAGYLYLAGLGAGAFVAATAAGWLGLGLADEYVVAFGWSTDVSGLFILWGPFAAALGASLLVFHLGKNWWRFWSA